jgi:hypothetical protein
MDDPQLFVIRVWQDAHRFRASVRAADDAPPRLFTAAEELALFLSRAAQMPATAPATVSPPDAPRPRRRQP